MHSYGCVRKCKDFPSNTWHDRTISCWAFGSRSPDFMTPKGTQIRHVDSAMQPSTCVLTEANNYLGSSSCMVKNHGKGRKMTGFQRQEIIIVLMEISEMSRTSMAK